jgi:hypothetical protein
MITPGMRRSRCTSAVGATIEHDKNNGRQPYRTHSYSKCQETVGEEALLVVSRDDHPEAALLSVAIVCSYFVRLAARSSTQAIAAQRFRPDRAPLAD